MNKELEMVLEEIITLLTKCGQAERSKWFREKSDLLKAANVAEKKKIMNELNGIAVGMGSFADLPLKPSKDCTLTRDEVEVLQWELADKLGRSTR